MKRFSLEEANALLPELTRRLAAAHDEMAPLWGNLAEANTDLLSREWKIRQAREQQAPRIAMQELQAEWDEAAAHLVALRDHVDERAAAWVRLIERSGVLVRDLKRGSVDFPAREGGVSAQFCWTLGEPEIAFWHPLDEHEDWTRRSLEERA